MYSVVRQEDGITQALVAAKARLAKRDLTVPRLELVSAHMATNLVVNVKNALKDLPEPTLRLAGQSRRPPLDSGKWLVLTVCYQPRAEDKTTSTDLVEIRTHY